MARKTFYITSDQPHPLYKTRMLQAGQIELNAGAAALYRKMGVKMSDTPPTKAAPKAEAEAAPAKPTPRKRTRRAK